jgi:hypothetical protein
VGPPDKIVISITEELLAAEVRGVVDASRWRAMW